MDLVDRLSFGQRDRLEAEIARLSKPKARTVEWTAESESELVWAENKG